MDVADRVRQIIVEHLACDEAEVIAGTTNLADDLGADSLDAIEIVMALEEEYDIEFDDDECERMKTVQNAVDFVKKKLGVK